MNELSAFSAFGAGLISFLSPCVLPVYPAFLSYITGISIHQNDNKKLLFNKRAFLHTLFFILGFSMIYLALGFTTSYFAKIFQIYQNELRVIGAILIIFFGMILAGIFQPKMLLQNKRFEFKNRPSGYFGSFLIGLAFSAGWTPCMGPTLGYFITLSATEPSFGLLYMVCYIIGFAIPFIILSFFIDWIKAFRKLSAKLMIISGWILIVMGFVLLLDWMNKITTFISKLIPFY